MEKNKEGACLEMEDYVIQRDIIRASFCLAYSLS